MKADGEWPVSRETADIVRFIDTSIRCVYAGNWMGAAVEWRMGQQDYCMLSARGLEAGALDLRRLALQLTKEYEPNWKEAAS